MLTDHELTAYHEAGHAVAYEMRGGSFVRNASIEATADHRGITHGTHNPYDVEFVCYAGPWAQGHAAWLHVPHYEAYRQ